MLEIAMTVNGRQVKGHADSNTLLVDFLRKNLQLTGTHVGCDTSQCGACVVHMNGDSVKSCTTLAVQGDEDRRAEEWRLVQAAFKEAHGLQCGFCTPGMVMSTADLLTKNPNPTEDEIRFWLKGNICRCTGYHNIVKAVQIAAKNIASGAKVAAE